MTLTDIFTNLIFKKKKALPPAPVDNGKVKKVVEKRREIKLTIRDLENMIRKQKDEITELKVKLKNLQKADRNIQGVQKKLVAEAAGVKQKFTEYSEYLKKPTNPTQKREVETVLAALGKNLTEFQNAEAANQKTLNKITNDSREIKRAIDLNQRALLENEKALKMVVAAEGKVEIEEKGIEELERAYLPEEEAAAEAIPVSKTESKIGDEILPISKKNEGIQPPPPSPVTDDDYWKKGLIMNKKKTGQAANLS